MTLSEVLQKLIVEGFPATQSRVKHAMLTGRISRPPRDGAGNYQFANRQLVELRAYLDSPRRRGRKAKQESER